MEVTLHMGARGVVANATKVRVKKPALVQFNASIVLDEFRAAVLARSNQPLNGAGDNVENICLPVVPHVTKPALLQCSSKNGSPRVSRIVGPGQATSKFWEPEEHPSCRNSVALR